MSNKSWRLPYYAMGEFTVVQEVHSDWIVLEDGRRVGGTLRYPFKTRGDAQRWVGKEIQGEETGDASVCAMAKVIRQTDPGLWARYEQIEADCAGANEDERIAAHDAAGTHGLVVQLACASLEAQGKIHRSPDMTRDGLPLFRIWPDQAH